MIKNTTKFQKLKEYDQKHHLKNKIQNPKSLNPACLHNLITASLWPEQTNFITIIFEEDTTITGPITPAIVNFF